MTKEEYISRMVDISTKKLKLLEEILSLTLKQSEVIKEDSINELEDIIEEKQKRIDEINNLDEDFQVYFQRMKTMLNISSFDDLKDSEIRGTGQLSKIIIYIVSLIESISINEKKNNESADTLLKDIGKEIKKLNQRKKINNAYAITNPSSPSYFIDKKK